MEKIKLCIIGYKVQTNCEQENAQFFNYLTHTWQLASCLQMHYNEITNIIKKCEDLKLYKQGLSLLEEEFQLKDNELQTVLVVVYHNASNRTRQQEYEICSILSKLLPILYTNYRPSKDICLQMWQSIFTTEERLSTKNLVTTYVTSQLYDELYQAHLTNKKTDINIDLPADFKPTLYKFQKRTVSWLLQREQKTESMLPLWEELLPNTTNHNAIFKHKYRLRMQTDRPNAINLPKGGILADEMGLGKTVEMLTLITLNKCKAIKETYDYSRKQNITNCKNTERKRIFCLCINRTAKNLIQCKNCLCWQHAACVSKFDVAHDASINEPYFCPLCWQEISKEQMIISGATIIVTPNSIRAQWLAEIKLHAPMLRSICYDSQDWISPRQLAAYDVVVTDYNVLRSEVYHTDEYVSERKTRHPPRYMRRITPLLMLQWHRVCLDEAQMVESNTSQLAELVQKLPTVHRWAVTGTPIHRSIDDLQPMLQFIGLYEICDAWKALVHNFLKHQQFNNKEYKDVPPLIELLQQCMWRTCKKNVINEVEIPPQSIFVHKIKLMDLENLHYIEQHEKQQFQFQNVLQKHANNYQWGIRTISPKILYIILQPLLKIRQCCSVATVANSQGKFNSKGNVLGGQHHKQFLDPIELHAHMKSVNEVECKTVLRTMASSYNGMAAVKFLQKDYRHAIKYYDQVLKLSKEHNTNNISVDSLLQIHAIHNLLQANNYLTVPADKQDIGPEDVKELEKQYGVLEWKYLEHYNILLKNVYNDYLKAENFFKENPEESLIADIALGIENLQMQQSNALMAKLKAECREDFINSSKYIELQTLSGFLFFLDLWINKLLEKRLVLQKTFQGIKFFTENMAARHQVSVGVWRDMMALVRNVYECHLNEIREQSNDKSKNEDIEPPKVKKPKKILCILCECKQQLDSYFCLLYETELSADNNKIEGVERASIEIQFTRTILLFVRNKCKTVLSNIQINGNLETLDMLHTFYQRASKYWIELEFAVKAYDELDMCKMRLSVTDNIEETSNFRVLSCELDNIFDTQNRMLTEAQSIFVKKLGRLKYINHLGENSDAGSCPICCTDFEMRYSVLECGHHLCLKCLQLLKQKARYKEFDCSICRNRQSVDKIYFVTKSTISKDVDEIQIKWNYSSKIIKILQVLLELRQKDPTIKVLIFSQWMPILKIISNALQENNISFRMQYTVKAIEEFKNINLNIMCLLMPFQRGCKGLNLIEATHVFLVEPILNPGEELQAIGRVHRFGQTKPTTVHRFIVSNSIEENIYNFTTKEQDRNGKSWEFADMTLQDLEQLFVLKSYDI